MLRIATEVFEVVGTDRSVTAYPDLEAARAARGTGQVRRRTVHSDVPAEYAVRSGDVEHGRSAVPAEAATLSRAHPGSKVVMVPAATAEVSPPV